MQVFGFRVSRIPQMNLNMVEVMGLGFRFHFIAETPPETLNPKP